MLNTFAARARFYDITGYLFPGQILIFVIWSYLRVFDNPDFAWQIVKHAQDNWIAALVLVFLAGAYVLGHVVNSASSLIIEKWLFKDAFAKNSDWIGRAIADKSGRGAAILKCFEDRFGYKPESSFVPEVAGWADEFLPNAAMSGFRFLSFYGLCRSMVLLTFVEMFPFVVWVYQRSHCVCGAVMAAVVSLLLCWLFLNQYLRFVKYCADFNAATLLMHTQRRENYGTT